jgi:hypothetical protein
MSTTASRKDPTTDARAAAVDPKLGAIVIPGSDVDRSLDADFAFDNGVRVVRFTPPGSPASIQFGTRVTTAELPQ